jgi:deoxyribose-phosphate aldolase
MTAPELLPDIKAPKDLAPYIDHTILEAKASREEIKKVCEEAAAYGFATVCVNSGNIKYVAQLLAGSKVKPIAVVGFPLGAAASDAKAFEAQTAVELGAQEIDMVINIAELKAQNYAYVFNDIAMVVRASGPFPVKVILETSELTDEQKVAACVLAKAAGAAFVKTSTGFSKSGATVSDVALMKKTVGRGVQVKASGGIRSYDDALAMIIAGATRIGASKSVAIVKGEKSEQGSY